MWLDAAAITGLTDGQTVATWSDRSAAGNHATGVNAPTYQTGVLSGKPVVRFPGAGYFTSTASASASQQTLIAVVQAPTTGGSRTVKGAAVTGGWQVRVNPGATARVEQLKQSLVSLYVGPQTLATPAWGVVVATTVVDGPCRCSWGDTGSTTILAGTFTATTAQIGRSGSNGGSEYYAQDMAELAAWDRELTVPEINAVVAGLKSKWGIA